MPSDIPAALMPAGATADDILYVADAQLNVVFVNPSWRNFAGQNNGLSVLGAGWNSHLLANFSGSELLRWQAIYAQLLAGRLETHEENFICPSPVERRTYRLQIHRHLDAMGNTAYLAHHAVRVDGKRDVSVLRERLRALDDDPAATVEAYKRLVPGRPVRSVRLATAQLLAPLEEVGGDLLWQRDWRAGTDLVIADVMGHGVDAARLATKIVLLLDAHAGGSLSVADNVAQLNRLLVETVQGGQPASWRPLFATGLYLRVNQSLESLTLCSFGHVGPIFSTSGCIEVKSGLPVGIAVDDVAAHWPELVLRFAEHGRRFIIFTDGLTEQFNLAGEMMGEAGIKRAFQRAAGLPLPEVVEAIRAAVNAFRGDALVKDDQALLAIEVAGD